MDSDQRNAELERQLDDAKAQIRAQNVLLSYAFAGLLRTDSELAAHFLRRAKQERKETRATAIHLNSVHHYGTCLPRHQVEQP